MKLAIIHISDIHLTGRFDRHTQTSIARSRKVGAAVVSTLLDKGFSPDQIVLAVTGDIAFSGTAEQYAVAEEIISNVREKVEDSFAAHIAIVLVPGNHDCNFTNAKDFRDTLVASVQSPSLSRDTLEVALQPQHEFREFSERASRPSPTPISAIHHRVRLHCGSKTVEVNLYNSSWMSRNPERPGTLIMPGGNPELVQDTSPDADLSIALMHHPPGWVTPDTYHEWRDYLRKNADIVLTGHEHVAGSTITETEIGSRQHCIEGGVFSESSRPMHSSFNLILVDHSTGRSSRISFDLRDGKYIGDSSPMTFHITPRSEVSTSRLRISREMEEYVEDPGMEIQHPRSPKLRLGDYYVHPELREVDLWANERRSNRVVSSQQFMDVFRGQRVLVIGPELSGKTSLAKRLVVDANKANQFPVFLSCRGLVADSDGAVLEWVSSGIERTYGKDSSQTFFDCTHREERMVVVDDFHLLKGGQDVRARVLNHLPSIFDSIALLSGESQEVRDIIGKDGSANFVAGYTRYRLLEFSSSKSWELIHQWCRLGIDFADDERDVVRSLAERERVVLGAIRTRLVPALPSNILLLLHYFEAHRGGERLSSASSGLLYQAMLTSVLNQPGNEYRIETKLNYLAELAYRIFRSGQMRVDRSTFDLWHDEYCDKMGMKISRDRIGRELIESARVLYESDSSVGFRYRYAFYYFVAKYISDHFSDESVVGDLSRLLDNLHREDAGNIILFLCHSPRNESVLSQLSERAARLFSDKAEFDFAMPSHFSSAQSSSIGARRIADGSVIENRRQASSAYDISPSDEDNLLDESFDPDVMGVAAATKIIDIIGQVIRSYPGTFEKKTKMDMVKATYSLALRTASAIAELSARTKSESMVELQNIVREMRPELVSDGEVASAAEAMIERLFKAACFGVVKHTSSCIATHELEPIYDGISAERPKHVPSNILDISVRFDMNRGIPFDRLRDVQSRMHGSLPLADYVLQSIAWHYLYLFPADHDDRQRLCAMAKIKLPKAPPRLTDGNQKSAKVRIARRER